MILLNVIRKYWFLLGIIFVIVLANISPGVGSRGGVLRPEITIKYLAVGIIFFNSGISMQSEALAKATLQAKDHLFIQTFTFVVFPVVIQWFISSFANMAFTSHITEGFQILSCMPPPVSSAVILTKAVGGNEAAAIFNSALGSFLGIFLTPGLILLTLGSEASVPFGSIFLQLFFTVVMPLVCGQVVRSFSKEWLQRNPIPFSTIGSVILLLIIFTTFCDTFQHSKIEIDGSHLLLIIIFISGLQCFFLLCIFYLSTRKLLGYQPEDTVALMFCATHKSLTLGIPIIKILFSDDEKLSVISIPLLVYHPTQILLGSLLVPFLQEWLQRSKNSRHHVLQMKMV